MGSPSYAAAGQGGGNVEIRQSLDTGDDRGDRGVQGCGRGGWVGGGGRGGCTEEERRRELEREVERQEMLANVRFEREQRQLEKEELLGERPGSVFDVTGYPKINLKVQFADATLELTQKATD